MQTDLNEGCGYLRHGFSLVPEGYQSPEEEAVLRCLLRHHQARIRALRINHRVNNYEQVNHRVGTNEQRNHRVGTYEVNHKLGTSEQGYHRVDTQCIIGKK